MCRKKTKTKTKKSPPKKESPVKTNDDKLSEESDNYFNELVRGGHRVKSISQYKDKTVKKSPQDSGQDSSTVDDSYFKEVMKKGGNVTSVSKYNKS